MKKERMGFEQASFLHPRRL